MYFTVHVVTTCRRESALHPGMNPLCVCVCGGIRGTCRPPPPSFPLKLFIVIFSKLTKIRVFILFFTMFHCSLMEITQNLLQITVEELCFMLAQIQCVCWWEHHGHVSPLPPACLKCVLFSYSDHYLP